MTTLLEAAKQALDIIDRLWEVAVDKEYNLELLPTMKALRQAIENESRIVKECKETMADLKQAEKREWVELTFEEADKLISKYSNGFRTGHNDALDLVDAVEAKLKEKNGG